ncbi:CPBP family intramembrane metalloprotease [Alteromonadaceae bacterium M269]|nr:CPBP family intramembrane metalloprotease [Alteromonadaceae bacterium M269]
MSVLQSQAVYETVKRAKLWFSTGSLVAVILVVAKNTSSFGYWFNLLPVLGSTLPYTIGIVIMLHGFRLKKGHLPDTGLRLPYEGNKWRSLCWILGLSILVLIARVSIPFLFNPLLEVVGPRLSTIERMQPLVGNLSLLLSLLPIMWFVVFFEEWLFRGVLIGYFEHQFREFKFSIVIAIVLSSLIFGLLHFGNGARSMLSSLLGGLIYGIAFILTKRNLWPVYLTHCMVNSLGFLSVYLNN